MENLVILDAHASMPPKEVPPVQGGNHLSEFPNYPRDS